MCVQCRHPAPGSGNVPTSDLKGPAWPVCYRRVIKSNPPAVDEAMCAACCSDDLRLLALKQIKLRLLLVSL